MERSAWLSLVTAVTAVLSCGQVLAAGPSVPENARGAWLGFGVGVASLDTPAAGSTTGLALNFDLGVRLTSQWGVALELGTNLPSGGCNTIYCAWEPEDFVPDVDRIVVVGEYRPAGSGWRLRAGLGAWSYCYATYAYYLGSCSDVGTIGASASVAYHWQFPSRYVSSMGLRLGIEAADFPHKSSVGLPSYNYRAASLTLQIGLD